jgi:hypothetical protein
MAQAEGFGSHLNRISDLLPDVPRKLPPNWCIAERLRGLQRRPAAAKDEILVSKVVQLRAAVAFRGYALPQHLNLMSSDADDRATSVGLASVVAHPDDTVA